MLQTTFSSSPIPIKKTTNKKPGRPSKQITEQELKEILQGITNPNPAKRQLIIKQFPEWKIKNSINIYRTDYGKHGAISKAACPFHGKEHLGYGWHNYREGVRIKCLVENCKYSTHFEPMLYLPTANPNQYQEN